MKTAAAIAAVIAAIILLPFGAVMMTGAPPPSLTGGTGSSGTVSCGKTTTATSVATGSGSGALPKNWKAIAQFLMAHGYSKNAAAGIDGNIQSESGGDPEQLEIGGGGGTGIIQWTPASSAAPLQPIVTGNAQADLATQLTDLLTYNNQNGAAAIATLNAEPAAGAAAAYYEAVFERPASLADAGTRSSNATAVLAALDKGTSGGGGVTTVSTATPCPAAKTATAGNVTPLATGKAATAIAYAKAQLGKPYVWGGTGPDGYDCSGLVMMAWRAAGVNIQRTSQAQWSSLQHETAAQAQPGDLVFYAGADGTLSSPGHVVMFLGGGQVIQAYATGTPIEISTLASMTSSGLVGYARP